MTDHFLDRLEGAHLSTLWCIENLRFLASCCDQSVPCSWFAGHIDQRSELQEFREEIADTARLWQQAQDDLGVNQEYPAPAGVAFIQAAGDVVEAGGRHFLSAHHAAENVVGSLLLAIAPVVKAEEATRPTDEDWLRIFGKGTDTGKGDWESIDFAGSPLAVDAFYITDVNAAAVVELVLQTVETVDLPGLEVRLQREYVVARDAARKSEPPEAPQNNGGSVAQSGDNFGDISEFPESRELIQFFNRIMAENRKPEGQRQSLNDIAEEILKGRKGKLQSLIQARKRYLRKNPALRKMLSIRNTN